MRRIIKHCSICQIPFFPRLTKEHIQKYCSANCRRKQWRINHKEEDLLARKAYTKRKIEEGYYRKKYAQKYKVEIKPRSCQICQVLFTPDWRHNFQKFCSRKCRRKHDRQIYRKKHKDELHRKDNFYKARIRFGATSKTLNKTVVLKRDKELCQICSNPYQVIHHIKYSGLSKDLVCLCRACHATIHQRFNKEPFWKEDYNFDY